VHLKCVAFFLALVCASVAQAQKIEQVTWQTAHTAPPVTLHGSTKEWLPMFRMGLASLPESSVVALCLSQPQLLGLNAKEAATLQKLTAERYALMVKDAVFQKAPSALPYCFTDVKPVEGLGTVHLPAGCNPRTPSIVFLHGYGGSFLWQLHVLVEAFPQHLIVCPAYGMSCNAVPREYVRGAVEAAEKKLGFAMTKPSLMGLSAGGFGACALYAQKPDNWRRVVCLAAYAREPVVSQFAAGMDLRFIAGKDEFFVLDGSFQRGVDAAKRRGARVDSFLVPESGHFFLLEKREETIEVLRRWLAD
jgi:hypothetical protein